ncbi:hypothetical protein U6A24_08400 [Aquimarina gracilis]|uniref:Uncharacterized protein n=1 Tax=Aquimarina gracilis TaxID=874422 RepID=A0ABU5ZUB3_9FLAO|nr:hypothetical protein [Aquimarina gracilis]MEB3345475.1 hypothetical protein [Aquimarina gracilis]
MTTQLHLAAQYLAAAGISFLEKKEDDSHTNLGFSITEGNLYTRPLNEAGDTLSLNYHRFTLEWNSKNSKSSLRLDKTLHSEVLKWIQVTAEEANIKKQYNYDFHYDLPYDKITNDFEFKLTDPSRLKRLIHFRTLAQLSIKTFLENHKIESDIRIWPHHFDTGAFAMLKNKSNMSIGLGLAIPDSVVNDYYLYISGYHGHDAVDTSNFNSLTIGNWYTEGFKGAVLPVSEIDQKDAVIFFDQAFSIYSNQ